jgi:hypothetical protein
MATAKCICPNIIAPQKPQAPHRPAVYLDLIVSAGEQGGKGQVGG